MSVPEKDWAQLQGPEQRTSFLRQVLQGPSALEAHQLAALQLPGLPVPSPSASTMDTSIEPAASADSSVHSRCFHSPLPFCPRVTQLRQGSTKAASNNALS